jgi:hypothetical protein
LADMRAAHNTYHPTVSSAYSALFRCRDNAD